MNLPSLPIVVCFLTSLAFGQPAPLHAQGIQDLLSGRSDPESASPRPRVRRVVDRNRTDLYLAADVLPNATGRNFDQREVGIEAALDVDFICGQFDLKGTFRNLLGKEVREEFLEGLLGYLESEVTGSAMELLCQAQPTACTLLQNHNIAANLKLGYHYDRCAAIEGAIDHAQRRVYAGAVEQCLREKKAAGVPLDQALDACRRASRVRGFGGEALAEFDLARELTRLVGLSDEGRALLEGLSEETRYGATWAKSRPDANVVTRRHDRIRKGYLKRWQEAIRKVRTGGTLTEEELSDLAPPGRPVVTEQEVIGTAVLPPHERDLAIGSLSSAAAFPQLTREIHEVERALEAVAGAPTIEEGQRKMLEGRLGRLRKERERLEELYGGEEFFKRALLGVRGLVGRDLYARRGEARGRAVFRSRRKGLYASCSAWGSRGNVPPEYRTPPSPPAPGPLPIGGSGGLSLDYEIGALGSPR